MAVNGDKRWYVLVGGGSGGHVLPLKIIAEKLLNQEAESRVLIITDYKYYQRTEEIFKKLRAEFNEERLVLKKG
jgi:UDP-N-acetylglucosamine:LPS N-acetylglucosamine transferase